MTGEKEMVLDGTHVFGNESETAPSLTATDPAHLSLPRVLNSKEEHYGLISTVHYKKERTFKPTNPDKEMQF